MKTVSALFQREADAKSAREALLSHGLAAGRVSLVDRHRPPAVGSETGTAKGRSLWGTIKDIVSIPTDVAPDFDARQSRGGFLVTATIPDERMAGALAILERDGIVRFEGPDGPSWLTARGGASSAAPAHERVRLQDYRDWIALPSGQSRAEAIETLFLERSIEMTETADQVAFRKDARIKEEVVIRKQVRERVQRVDAVLRHTEAEATRTHRPEPGR